jgi:hypothetical protein
MKSNILSLVVFVLLIYLVPTLGPKAVVPPPDGGYPGFNTAEGQNALFVSPPAPGTQQLAGFRSLGIKA